jgi:hypothetical protein
MRIPTELRAKALIRQCAASGVTAVVVRHGDDDAGMLYVKVRLLDGNARILGPAPAGLTAEGDLPRLVPHLDGGGVPERTADDYLTRQIGFDPDLWLIEIEDRHGASFLDD